MCGIVGLYLKNPKLQPQLGDHQLQVHHHGLGAAGAGLGLTAGRLFGRERGAQGLDLV